MGTVQKCLDLDVAAGFTFLIEKGVHTVNINLGFVVSFHLQIGEGSHSSLQVERAETFREGRIALHAVLRLSSCLIQYCSARFSGFESLGCEQKAFRDKVTICLWSHRADMVSLFFWMTRSTQPTVAVLITIPLVLYLFKCWKLSCLGLCSVC